MSHTIKILLFAQIAYIFSSSDDTFTDLQYVVERSRKHWLETRVFVYILTFDMAGSRSDPGPAGHRSPHKLLLRMLITCGCQVIDSERFESWRVIHILPWGQLKLYRSETTSEDEFSYNSRHVSFLHL